MASWWKCKKCNHIFVTPPLSKKRPKKCLKCGSEDLELEEYYTP